MASVLAGVTPPQRVDLASDLMRGQQARQSVLAGQQQLQQGQMQLDRAPQVAAQQDQQHAMQMQRGQQQISEADFMQAVQRGRIINRLARQVREMPEGQRGQFVQSLNPEMLQSVGIDPEMLQSVGLDDRSLDAIIAQTEAALQETGQDAPAQLREFQGMASAAGLQEGDEDFQRAARVRLGLEGRASGAGMQTFRMRDARGRERIFRFSPQDGSLQAYDGQGWVTAGPEEQQIAASGQAEMRPMEQGERQPQQDTSELFVGRPREEEAQAVAERTPEKGYRFNEQGRMVPIEGSPEARAVEQARRAARGTLDRKIPGILRDIERAINLADRSGPIAGAFAQPGQEAGRLARASAAMSPAFELNQHLDSIKSNISIDELQSMREASPTGGALGQVPVRQQEFLMQVQGALIPTLQPDVLRENLNRVQNNYMNLYLNAIYGDEQEWQEAIADGRATPEDMEMSLQEKQEMRQQYLRQTEFGEFGERRDQDQPSIDDLLRRYGN